MRCPFKTDRYMAVGIAVVITLTIIYGAAYYFAMDPVLFVEPRQEGKAPKLIPNFSMMGR